jgi:hypothetical protein
MKTREETRETRASSDAIWTRWVEADKWPEHNADLEWARVEGPLAVGSRIVMKPRGRGETSTTITELTPHERFRTETRLPLARLSIDHEMTALPGGGTRFTHRWTLSGPLSGLFWKLFGERASSSLPKMLDEIVRIAEAKQP